MGLRVAAAGGFRCALQRVGGCVVAASSPRRRGVRIVIGAIALVVLAGCTTAIDFRTYRACYERPGTNLHDPGLVVGEDLGDDNRKHYRFLPDRNRDDERQVIDVTRVNRMCALVTGVNAATGEPVGNVWDLTERPREER